MFLLFRKENKHLLEWSSVCPRRLCCRSASVWQQSRLLSPELPEWSGLQRYGSFTHKPDVSPRRPRAPLFPEERCPPAEDRPAVAPSPPALIPSLFPLSAAELGAGVAGPLWDARWDRVRRAGTSPEVEGEKGLPLWWCARLRQHKCQVSPCCEAVRLLSQCRDNEPC